jgi:hypothetical protein
LSTKKYTLAVVGEALREAGTLIIVFTPLYQLFEPVAPRWFIIMSVLLLGFAALLGGIEVERRRRA